MPYLFKLISVKFSKRAWALKGELNIISRACKCSKNIRIVEVTILQFS